MRMSSKVAGRSISDRQAGARLQQPLVRRAPGPEQPDVRDRAGAQRGMAILIGGGVAFWGAVAAVVIHLMG